MRSAVWNPQRTLVAFLAILAFSAAACSVRIRPTTVSVPQTPEGQKCWRECEQIKQTCLGKCQGNLFSYGAVQQCVEACAVSRDQCLLGCPGAVDSHTPQSGASAQ